MRNGILRCCIGQLSVLAAMLPIAGGAGWIHSAMGMSSPTAASTVITSVVVAAAPNDPDPEAAYTAVQQEFWTWAWQADYSPEESVITMEQTTKSAWQLTALAGSSLQTIVGTGQFTSAAWYELATHSIAQTIEATLSGDTAAQPYESEDVVSDELQMSPWLVAGADVSAVAGTVTRIDGQQLPIAALVVKQWVGRLDDPSSLTAVYGFAPIRIMKTLTEATSFVQELYVSLTEPGGNGEGGIAGFPCAEGVAYELQTCECQCSIDYGNCQRICRHAALACVYACLGGAVVGEIVCFAACYLLVPACIGCLAWVTKAVLACLGLCISILASCEAGCALIYANCEYWCP